ncbi:hypothetical protein HGRIS_013591 [Hohenbuehelia grisea]|uniref:BTB domain-containing protein n=1 Tax=Hohenbuehelia grisea TaxID=104357 RepID=A0ABR3IW70_9AGAR
MSRSPLNSPGPHSVISMNAGEFHRDTKLWFTDGTVLLTARQTTMSENGTTPEGDWRFRVHGSMLCAHSTVFQDMFAFPVPSDVELLDGLPFVHLSDEAHDVRAFLRLIYDPHFTPTEQYSPVYSIKMRGALKLAAKYQAEELKLRILKQLRLLWPNTLPEWDQRTQVVMERRKARGLPTYSTSFDWVEDAFAPHVVIAMLRDAQCEHDVPDVLSRAYYFLSSHPEHLSSLPPGYLTVNDYQTIVRGGYRLRKQMTNVLTLGDATGESCCKEQFKPCKKDCEREYRWYCDEFWQALAVATDFLEYLASSQRLTASLCPSCSYKLRKEMREDRQGVFDLIPGAFCTNDDG